MELKWKPGKKGNRVSFSYSTLIVLGFYMALKRKPDKREPSILSVFHLHYRGFFSAAMFCAEVLGSELLLTGFFWSSFPGVKLTKFFFPRAFRLWIPKRCRRVHGTSTPPSPASFDGLELPQSSGAVENSVLLAAGELPSSGVT